jgi:hypothetical protein
MLCKISFGSLKTSSTALHPAQRDLLKIDLGLADEITQPDGVQPVRGIH